MENKNQKDSSDYQFIREKVVSARKRRWRKMLLWSAFTVFLAVLFGLIARLVFLCSDEPLKRFLGIAEPSPGPSINPEADVSPTPFSILSPTLQPANPSGEPGGPEGTPSGRPDLTPGGLPETTQGVQPSGAPVSPAPTAAATPAPTGAPETEEERAKRVLADYAALFAAVQKISGEVQRSLVTVEVVEDGVDWLENPYETKSQTTGIIVGKTEEQLLVLVNLDRVQDASHIVIICGSGSCEAELWNYDRDYNLAVVRIPAERVPRQLYYSACEAVFGDSSLLQVGTPVMALGNPNGYAGSMELGMVTSRGSVFYITDNSIDLFNTDTIDSTDGDGVIVNLKGEIVGIITRTFKSGLNLPICTAMGSAKLLDVIEKLSSGGERIYFGVLGEDIPAAALQEAGLSNGIYVTEVMTDSPAFEAGLKTGDIILKVNGNNVYSYGGFHKMLSRHTPGEELSVTVQRTVRMSPKQVELKVLLAKK